MNNNKLCIVPFTKKEYPLIENLSKNYSSITFVSPKGIGADGQDISILKNTNKVGYKFTNSISEGIVNSDVILITEINKEDKALYRMAIQALEASIANSKEIICFLEFEESEYSLYQQQCKEKEIKHYFFNYVQEDIDAEKDYKKFNIPVIYISEMIPGCDGYETFLKVMDRFQSDGKNVLAISQDAYNILFNQVQMVFWTKTDSRKMVYRLNKTVYDLVNSRRPDIVLIKLPEPMMKYDDNNTYDFGLTASLLAQAIPGDGCICCTYGGTPLVDFWNNINESFTAKFGYSIIGVHVCNQIIDVTEEKWISTIHISDSEIQNEINLLNKYNNIEFYQLLRIDEFDRFYEMLETELFDIPYGVIKI